MFRTFRIMRRRAIAGAAAVGGAAYHVAQRANPERYEQAPEADVAPPPPPKPVGQMRELDELREQGILTREEFAAEKRKLLGI